MQTRLMDSNYYSTKRLPVSVTSCSCLCILAHWALDISIRSWMWPRIFRWVGWISPVFPPQSPKLMNPDLELRATCIYISQHWHIWHTVPGHTVIG